MASFYHNCYTAHLINHNVDSSIKILLWPLFWHNQVSSALPPKMSSRTTEYWFTNNEAFINLNILQSTKPHKTHIITEVHHNNNNMVKHLPLTEYHSPQNKPSPSKPQPPPSSPPPIHPTPSPPPPPTYHVHHSPPRPRPHLPPSLRPASTTHHSM